MLIVIKLIFYLIHANFYPSWLKFSKKKEIIVKEIISILMETAKTPFTDKNEQEITDN